LYPEGLPEQAQAIEELDSELAGLDVLVGHQANEGSVAVIFAD
jgi:hypothetical protein